MMKVKGKREKVKVLRLTFTFFLFTFTFGCATQPQPLVAPEWNVVPQGVVDTFCLRLKTEGAAEGQPVAIVSTTQPIASMQAIAALAGPTQKRPKLDEVATALQASQRSIPITLASGGPCEWIAIDAASAYRRHDQIVVELSAPIPNPLRRGSAGLFVRVSLAGEHGQWYWITLLPRGGGWVVGFIEALGV